MRRKCNWVLILAILSLGLFPIYSSKVFARDEFRSLMQYGTSKFNCAAFSPDGQSVLIGTKVGATILDIDTREVLQFFRSGFVQAVAYSPVNPNMVVTLERNVAKIWSVDTGDLEFTHNLPIASASNTIVFSPDGLHLIVATGFMAETVSLITAQVETVYFTSASVGHTENILSIAVSPDGTKVLTGSQDRTMKMWDFETGDLLQTFEGHDHYVSSVAFHPLGNYVLSGSYDRTIVRWDYDGNEIMRYLDHNGRVFRVQFDPSGDYFLSFAIGGNWAPEDISAKYWSTGVPTSLGTYDSQNGNIFSCIDFNKDGTRFLTVDETNVLIWEEGLTPPPPDGGGGGDDDDGGGMVSLGGGTFGIYATLKPGHRNNINSVAISPELSKVLTGGDDGVARLWETETGIEIMQLSATGEPPVDPPPSGGGDDDDDDDDDDGGVEQKPAATQDSGDVNVVTFAYDDSTTWPLTVDTTVGNENGNKKHGVARRWSISDGIQEMLYANGEDSSAQMLCLGMNKQQSEFLTGRSDGLVEHWDFQSGEMITSFTVTNEKDPPSVTSVAFSPIEPPESPWALTGSPDGVARMWRMSDGQWERVPEYANFGGHPKDEPMFVFFSRNGANAYVVSGDMISIWDVFMGSLIKRIAMVTDPNDFSPIGTVRALSADLHPNQDWIVVGARNNIMSVWDLDTGRLLSYFDEHIGSISSVNFSSDGFRLLSGSYDDTALLWHPLGYPPPIASFYAIPTEGFVPLDVQFIDTSEGSVTTRTWDVENDGIIDYETRGAVTYHTYEIPGTYSVTLRAFGPGSPGKRDKMTRTDYIHVLLGAPTGVEATDGDYDDKIVVMCGETFAATHYQLYRSEGLIASRATTISAWQESRIFEDTTALPDTIYNYWVRAKAENEQVVLGDFSEPDEGWRRFQPPAYLLASDDVYPDRVRVTWEESYGLKPFYQVYRSYTVTSQKVAISAWQAGTAFDDTLAQAGVTYYYWIKSSSQTPGYPNSRFSRGDPGTAADGSRLPPPNDLSSGDISFPDRVFLTWTPVEGASYYRVYRAESPTSERTSIGPWGTDAFFEDYEILPGVVYYYWVRAAAGSTGQKASVFSQPDSGILDIKAPRFDLNQDGRADLILKNRIDGTVVFHHMNADGGSWNEPYNRDWTNYQLLGRGDMNGDGQSDLILLSTDTNSVFFCLVDQTGANWEVSYYNRLLVHLYTFLGMGDFNGDGRDDLVLKHNKDNTVFILHMNEQGADDIWTIAYSSEGWAENYSILAIGDLNGDERDDLILRYNPSGSIYYCLLNETGTSWDVSHYDVWNGEKSILGIGDLDGDNREDLILKDHLTQEVSFNLTGENVDTWSTVYSNADDWTSYSLTSVLDLNGDGLDDLIRQRTDGQVEFCIMRAGAKGWDVSHTDDWTDWEMLVPWAATDKSK